MSELKSTWDSLPAQDAVVTTATNLSGESLATVSCSGQASCVQVWNWQVDQERWSLTGQVQVNGRITCLVWAHPEHGALLIGGTDAGRLHVFQAQPPSIDQAVQNAETSGEPQWKETSGMKCSDRAVRQLAFAPRQLGLSVAAVSEEGQVSIFEADRLLSPRAWTLQSTFQASSPAPGPLTPPSSCSLCWRPFSPGTAPLLLVGCGRSAGIWQYNSTFMAWKQVFELAPSQSGAEVRCVHWARGCGRPCDLVALGSGSQVDIFSLQGESQALGSEHLACLQLAAPVWKVEWNLLGTCLGVGSEDQRVTAWRPDFVGQWVQVCLVEGAEEQQVMAVEGA